MTAFVLVSGNYTGGWVWQEVAERLRGSGAEVHPVTLTGMGEGGPPADAHTDLETHVEDLLRVIDAVREPQLVIVGHDYGIHPVLGAADRRPERISRIVYLDAGLPQDGDSVLATLRDPSVRERLLQRAERSADGRWIAPPPLDEQDVWGSMAGLTEPARQRLTTLAVPQPLGTFTGPLRLSGALAALPTSGIFCTAGGMSVALLQNMVRMGDPRLQPLADPRVGFFDLDTGHWPMLSRPAELAELLLRAAAGEGTRLVADERPDFHGPFLLDVEQRPRERVGTVDLYLPDVPADAAPRPAVILVHGGPVPAEARPTPRDWSIFTGYAGYLASQGVVGVTFDHRLHDIGDYGVAAEDVAAAVELVRADPRVDADRVALWFFSGGSLLSTPWLAAPPPWLRCLAATYPMLAPLPNWGFSDARFSPAAALAGAGELPIVLTRVELEFPELVPTVEKFLAAGKECGARVEVIDVPLGHHGFETIDHTEPAREAVRRAVASVLGHLGSLDTA
ncbi:alpha/beta hydrolase [Kitasatospora nipponensis]|uniref:Alpha/beta hydrolase n=1 Tax=Kitasatospora nipponensis TaxID=258049 RepID=A0ABN1W528_9ACTN